MAGIQWFDLIDTRTLTTTFISITSVGGDISHFEAGFCPQAVDKYAKDGGGISCSVAVPMNLDNLGDNIRDETKSDEPLSDVNPVSSSTDTAGKEMSISREKTLQDAVKPKNKREKKKSSKIAAV
ncbi:hypothetical protein FXO37_09278 [Capsicum annuum]|nr:hypothetical protein FXO37_09278 [Capsicum annuum]